MAHLERFDREKLAWAAGFMDGEGHFGSVNTQWRGQLIVSADQVDQQVLNRLKTALQMGKIYGPYTGSKPHHKDRFSFRIHGHEDVQAAVCLLWQWLSPVKRKQAIEVLSRYNSLPKPKRRPLSEDTKIAIRAARSKGLSYREIVSQFNISSETVCKVVKYGY